MILYHLKSKLLALLTLFFCVFTMHAQDILWEKSYGGKHAEYLFDAIPTPDYGFILAGSSISNKNGNKSDNNKGDLDYWVWKMDERGGLDWQKSFGGSGTDLLQSIKLTNDGGYILGGYSNSSATGDKTVENLGLGDYWIVKLDETGNITWQKTIGGDKDDNLFTLIQTKDKGFLLGGNSNSNASNSKKKSNGKGTDFWVVKLDETGDIVWQETYDYGKVDVLTSIVENEDHTFLIGGYAQSEIRNQKSEISKSSTSKNDKEGINDYIALKIKDNGEEIWTQTVGSKGTDILKKLLETRDGGYLLAGTSKSEQSRDKGSSIGENDFWVVKLKDKEKKQKTKTAVEAYPNPAESFTNTLVNYDYNDGWATLYDLNGRQLQKVELHGEHTVPIQLGNIPSGVYLVNIKTNNGEDSVKIIKN